MIPMAGEMSKWGLDLNTQNSPSPLRIERADTPSEAVVVLHGELDLGSSTMLSQILDTMIDQGHRRIVLDFSGVQFVNSTGLGVMVAVTRRLRSLDGDLIARSFQGIPLAALSITGLDRFLTIES